MLWRGRRCHNLPLLLFVAFSALNWTVYLQSRLLTVHILVVVVAAAAAAVVVRTD